MIKMPYYETSLKKWVVDCGDHKVYFPDGETAEDFYLMNKARYNEENEQLPST